MAMMGDGSYGSGRATDGGAWVGRGREGNWVLGGLTYSRQLGF